MAKPVVLRFTGDTSSLQRAFGTASKEADGFLAKMGSISGGLRNFGASTMRAGKNISLGVTLPAIAAGTAVFNMASDLNESISKVGVVFAENAGEIDKWSRSAASNMGISRQEALESAGTFGNLFKAMKIGTPAATDMSKGMVQLASDLASFNNANPEDVLLALRSGLVGEAEPLRKFGVNLSAARIEAKALEMGLADNAKELDAGMKAQAAYAIIMEDTTLAQGDFLRTADGAANSQRTLTARMKDSAAAIGQQLLPIGLKLMKFVSGLLDRFSNLSPHVQKIILIVIACAAALGPLVTIIGALATILGVVLSPAFLVVAAIAAIAAGVVYAYMKCETFRNIVDAVAQFLLTEVWPRIQAFAKYIAEQFGNLVEWVRAHWAEIEEAITHVVNVVSAIIDHFVQVALAGWRMFGDEITAVAKAAWDYIGNTIKNAVDFIRNVIEFALALINGDWGKAWDALKGMASAVWNQITNVIRFQVEIIKGIIGGIGSFFSGAWDTIVGVISGLPSRIASAASGMFDGIKDAFKSAINWIIRKWNDFKIEWGGFDPPGPGSIPGFTIDTPNIPLLANGDIVTRPTLAMIGEAGAEAAIPLTRPRRAMQLMDAAGLTDLALSRTRQAPAPQIIQNITALDPREAARIAAEEQEWAAKTGGL